LHRLVQSMGKPYHLAISIWDGESFPFHNLGRDQKYNQAAAKMVFFHKSLISLSYNAARWQARFQMLRGRSSATIHIAEGKK
jgi:hypothetical protein